MFFTFAHSDNKQSNIYTPDLHKMASSLGTKACATEYIVIGYERESIKMAVKMKSPVPVKRVVNKIRSYFNDYSGEVAFDAEDKRTYLEKAASIVAPLEPRDVDPTPLIFGDKTLKDLLRRIENARRGQGASREVPVNLFPDDMEDNERYQKEQELADDLVGANGSWASVMKCTKYLKMAQENLGFMREHFGFFSREAPSSFFSEEAIHDISNGHNQDVVDVVVNGKLEHHGTMGCTQEKYDMLVLAKAQGKSRDQDKKHEAFMEFMRQRALMTGRYDLRKKSDEHVLEFLHSEKSARVESVKRSRDGVATNPETVRRPRANTAAVTSIWASRRL